MDANLRGLMIKAISAEFQTHNRLLLLYFSGKYEFPELEQLESKVTKIINDYTKLIKNAKN